MEAPIALLNTFTLLVLQSNLLQQQSTLGALMWALLAACPTQTCPVLPDKSFM